jgi:hypothetical protein
MHIRVNIPQWGMAEYLNGIKAVFSTDSGYFIKELLSEVRSFCGLENVYLVSFAKTNTTDRVGQKTAKNTAPTLESAKRRKQKRPLTSSRSPV